MVRDALNQPKARERGLFQRPYLDGCWPSRKSTSRPCAAPKLWQVALLGILAPDTRHLMHGDLEPPHPTLASTGLSGATAPSLRNWYAKDQKHPDQAGAGGRTSRSIAAGAGCCSPNLPRPAGTGEGAAGRDAGTARHRAVPARSRMWCCRWRRRSCSSIRRTPTGCELANYRTSRRRPRGFTVRRLSHGRGCRGGQPHLCQPQHGAGAAALLP